MPNPNPPLIHLKPQTPKWQHLPTKAIRVPEIFLQEIADFARKLDNGEFDSPEPNQSFITIPSQASMVWLGIKPSISKLVWAFGGLVSFFRV
jgi:hypothetical protein